MSYDIKLQNYCDHKILWSRAQLEPDLRTVYFPYPLASVSSLIVRINGKECPDSSYDVKTVRQPLSLVLISNIEFFSKVLHNDPIIELFYVTFSDNCPKCLSVKTLDDINVNGSGDFDVIHKEVLLLQQVEKIIVTKLSSNFFHSWYGTGLHSLVGTKIADRDLLYTRVKEQVSNAIEKLKTVQDQMKASGRLFDPGELFGKILGINIEDTEDPSLILVTVTFTSQSGTSIEYSQYLSMNSTIRQRLVM